MNFHLHFLFGFSFFLNPPFFNFGYPMDFSVQFLNGLLFSFQVGFSFTFTNWILIFLIHYFLILVAFMDFSVQFSNGLLFHFLIGFLYPFLIGLLFLFYIWNDFHFVIGLSFQFLNAFFFPFSNRNFFQFLNKLLFTFSNWNLISFFFTLFYSFLSFTISLTVYYRISSDIFFIWLTPWPPRL